jgi:hypothetical protein
MQMESSLQVCSSAHGRVWCGTPNHILLPICFGLIIKTSRTTLRLCWPKHPGSSCWLASDRYNHDTRSYCLQALVRCTFARIKDIDHGYTLPRVARQKIPWSTSAIFILYWPYRSRKKIAGRRSFSSRVRGRLKTFTRHTVVVTKDRAGNCRHA